MRKKWKTKFKTYIHAKIEILANSTVIVAFIVIHNKKHVTSNGKCNDQ